VDFSGGLNNAVRADLLGDNVCQEFLNCEVNLTGMVEGRGLMHNAECIMHNELDGGEIVRSWYWPTYFRYKILADGGQQTADGGQQTSDSGQQTADGGRVLDGYAHIILCVKKDDVYRLYLYIPIADGGQQIADGGQQIADGGQQIADGVFELALDVGFSAIPSVAVTDRNVYVLGGVRQLVGMEDGNDGGYGGDVINNLTGSAGLSFSVISSGAYAGYYTVSKGSCVDPTVKIPNIYNGVEVRRVASNGFALGAIYLGYSISIPSSVREIGDWAFYSCNNLRNVYIGNGVEVIGQCSFTGLPHLHSISIPSSVRSIGADAFTGCVGLSRVKFYNGVESIEGSFKGCSSLVDVTLPNSLRQLHNGAFNLCISLRHIDLGNGLEELGSTVFEGCAALESITIPSSVSNFGTSGGSSGAIFRSCSSLRMVKFKGSSVFSTIHSATFKNCVSLERVVIPRSVTLIGYEAFSGCAVLASVYIPSSVLQIGAYAFQNCPNLTIYTEHLSRPAGWVVSGGSWNPNSRPVVWGAEMPEEGGDVVVSGVTVVGRRSPLSYFCINREGRLEGGKYGLDKPIGNLRVRSKKGKFGIGDTAGLPYGSILQYGYTLEDKEGLESPISNITTYCGHQFLWGLRSETAGDDYYLRLLQLRLSEVASEATGEIERINLYRQHCNYTEGDVWSGFCKIDSIKYVKGSLDYDDSHYDSEIELVDNVSDITGEEVLFGEGRLFVSDGYIAPFGVDNILYTIVLDNSNGPQFVNKIIPINIRKLYEDLGEDFEPDMWDLAIYSGSSGLLRKNIDKFSYLDEYGNAIAYRQLGGSTYLNGVDIYGTGNIHDNREVYCADIYGFYIPSIPAGAEYKIYVVPYDAKYVIPKIPEPELMVRNQECICCIGNENVGTSIDKVRRHLSGTLNMGVGRIAYIPYGAMLDGEYIAMRFFRNTKYAYDIPLTWPSPIGGILIPTTLVPSFFVIECKHGYTHCRYPIYTKSINSDSLFISFICYNRGLAGLWPNSTNRIFVALYCHGEGNEIGVYLDIEITHNSIIYSFRKLRTVSGGPHGYVVLLPNGTVSDHERYTTSPSFGINELGDRMINVSIQFRLDRVSGVNVASCECNFWQSDILKFRINESIGLTSKGSFEWLYSWFHSPAETITEDAVLDGDEDEDPEDYGVGGNFANLYISTEDFGDGLADDTAIFNPMYIWRKEQRIGCYSQDGENVKVRFEPAIDHVRKGEGLLYYSNADGAFKASNFFNTRSDILKMVLAPRFTADSSYNSLLLFYRDRMDILHIDLGNDGVFLQRNFVGNVYNEYLVDPNMCEVIGDSVYFVSASGLVRFGQGGVECISRGIVDSGKWQVVSGNAGFVQYVPDKMQIWYYFGRDNCMVYDIGRGVFYRFKFDVELVKGFFNAECIMHNAELGGNIFFSGGGDNKMLMYPVKSEETFVCEYEGNYFDSYLNGGVTVQVAERGSEMPEGDEIFSCVRTKRFYNRNKIKKIKTRSKFDSMRIECEDPKWHEVKSAEFGWREDGVYVIEMHGFKGDMVLEFKNVVSLDFVEIYYR